MFHVKHNSREGFTPSLLLKGDVKMQKLPHWILPDNFPALYDSESATAIEMTAKVYGAMQSMIDEYNNFVTNVNAEIVKFEHDTTRDIDEFKKCITEIMSNFIECSNTRINDAIFYMKDNIVNTTNDVVMEAIKNGVITISEAYDPESESLNMVVTEGGV